ncbi:hypothetical protein C8F01DRAFT_752518 [Mycena amicta]|nr:hypothetical protein C8F01DRAFT_752518 [Mycena amicta]
MLASAGAAASFGASSLHRPAPRSRCSYTAFSPTSNTTVCLIWCLSSLCAKRERSEEQERQRHAAQTIARPSRSCLRLVRFPGASFAIACGVHRRESQAGGHQRGNRCQLQLQRDVFPCEALGALPDERREPLHPECPIRRGVPPRPRHSVVLPDQQRWLVLHDHVDLWNRGWCVSSFVVANSRVLIQFLPVGICSDPGYGACDTCIDAGNGLYDVANSCSVSGIGPLPLSGGWADIGSNSHLRLILFHS